MLSYCLASTSMIAAYSSSYLDYQHSGRIWFTRAPAAWATWRLADISRGQSPWPWFRKIVTLIGCEDFEKDSKCSRPLTWHASKTTAPFDRRYFSTLAEGTSASCSLRNTAQGTQGICSVNKDIRAHGKPRWIVQLILISVRIMCEVEPGSARWYTNFFVNLHRLAQNTNKGRFECERYLWVSQE